MNTGPAAVYGAATETEAINTAAALAVSLGGRVVMTDGGASMAPLIPARAAVVVRDDFAAAAVGSVLLYFGSCSPRATRKTLCHRATARDAGGFIMRGDGNALAETWQRVTAANYLGTVLAVVNFP